MTNETDAAERDPAGSDAAGQSDSAHAALDAVHARAEAAAEDPTSMDEVDAGDGASLERWAQALGVPVEALEGAVKAVGTRVDRIKDYLTGGIAGDQEDA